MPISRIIFLIILCAVSVAGQTAESPATLRAKAAELENNEDWAGLSEHCRKWSKRQPKNTFALRCAGRGLIQNGYSYGIEYYRKALQLEPENIYTWHVFGEANLSVARTEFYRNRSNAKNYYTDAVSAFREALSLNPEYADSWRALGDTYIDLSSYDRSHYGDAITAYNQLVKIEPQNTRSWIHLGYLYDQTRRYKEAIAAYRKAMQIDPNSIDILGYLGESFFKSGLYVDAVNTYSKILRVKPYSPHYWHKLATTQVKLERYNDAIDSYLEVLQHGNPKDYPDYFNVWNKLIIIYRKEGRHREADESEERYTRSYTRFQLLHKK